MAHCALHIRYLAASPADDVVMVVTYPALIPRGAAGRLDPAEQSRPGQRPQRLVHGLDGNVADPVPDPPEDLVRAGVVTGPHDGQDGQPG